MMGVLAFFLDTKLGHLLIGLLCMALIGAGMYWRGHNKGWDAATAHYTAVVNSALAANQRDEQTIAELQAANRQWANAAKANAAKLSQAVKDSALAKAANAKALAEAQTKLAKTIHDNPEAHSWAAQRVPGVVLCQLQHGAHCPH